MTPAREHPFHVFRFRVDFLLSTPGSNKGSEKQPLCSGLFSECTGLEATMEPKTIKEGGRNAGPVQRMGKVSFATVVLKRGVTSRMDLWQWFSLVTGGAYAFRLDAEVTLLDTGEDSTARGIMTWKMNQALPTKFKAADFSSKATEVGVEELHFVHEGLELTVNKKD